MQRRTFIASLAGGMLGTLAGGAPFAQGLSKKPVRFVVPFPAGGSNDLFARAISDKLAARLGRPVIVESKPGASSSIGTDAVAKAEPDGDTLLLGSLATAVAPALMKTPWDPVKDLVGVAYLGVAPNLVTVHPSLAVNDLAGLVSLAKQRSGQLNYVNPGNGTSPHLGAEVFQYVNNVKLTPIGYKGAPPSVVDFLAGTVPVAFYPFGVIAEMVRAGKAKAIAIAAPQRSKLLPDVPTMAEQGFEGSQVNAWFNVMAPRATPAPIVERLNAEINAVLADPQTIAALESFGSGAVPAWDASRTTAMVAGEVARWAQFVRKSGIKAE